MTRTLIAVPVAAALALPLFSTPASAADVPAKAAALDSCRYQIPYKDDSRYAYSYSAVTTDGSVRPLTAREFDVVRMSTTPLDWRHVVQVDVCADGVQGVRGLRVDGKLDGQFDPSVPRSISSGEIKPGPASSIPGRPEITAVDRLDSERVTVRWNAAPGSFDRYALQEDKPFYQSELGTWIRYTYQVDVAAGTTSTVRRLETSTKPKDRTHTYWVRTVRGGFVSDLKGEKKISIQP